MTRILLTAALSVGASSIGIAAAAQAPPERPVLKNYNYDVVVSGCIKGKRIERPLIQSAADNLPFEALNATAFILDGPKELLKQIADEHKNHNDQITGIATVPPSMNRAQGAIATKKVGPLSIGIGGRQETSAIQSAPSPIRLKVSSFVHVQSGCASR